LCRGESWNAPEAFAQTVGIAAGFAGRKSLLPGRRVSQIPAKSAPAGGTERRFALLTLDVKVNVFRPALPKQWFGFFFSR